MRKSLLLPAAALAALALSACGHKAKNEAAEANESIGGDSNTMGAAVADVDAARNAAFSDAEANYSGPATDEAQGGEDSNEITD